MKSLLNNIPWLRSGAKQSNFIGLALSSDKVTAVHLQSDEQKKWQLVETKSKSFKGETGLSAAITDILDEFESSDLKVGVMLSQHMYQVVQIDKPNMTNDEIQLSLPFTIKDIVNTASDAIIADFIDSPFKHNGVEKITVFAANRMVLAPVISAVAVSEHELESLCCKELIYCDLLSVDKAAHMLVSQNFGEEPNLQIIRDGQLLLSRRLRGFMQLPELPLVQLKTHLLEQFGLELQRSLDFFESQLKQPPIKTLKLNIPNLELGGIISELGSFFPVKVTAFESQLDVTENQSVDVQYAIGAALQASQGGGFEKQN